PPRPSTPSLHDALPILRIDAGKFVTPVGAEFIEGYDGYNDNHSRSLLFTWAIPFTHTGFKLSYPFNDKFTAMVMLVNGWDNVVRSEEHTSELQSRFDLV